ncbi:MAG: hypothetical protein DHS20C20_02450 [Ardenticatenaceae bacterium]|nr:MAG: hypothetical protein DHS20C20_02450 [Ardenticatenaceae bacterium]
MNTVTITYIVYILLSLGITVWVAQTLFRNGRIFVIDAFGGNETMADAVNHLLLVGFYLVNIGFVSMYLSYGAKPTTTVEAIEYISIKIGVVLLVLGAMHFFNIFNFAKLRSKNRRKHGAAETAVPANPPSA